MNASVNITRNLKPMHESESDDDILRAFRHSLGDARDAAEPENNEIEKYWKYYLGQHYLRKGRDTMGRGQIQAVRVRYASSATLSS